MPAPWGGFAVPAASGAVLAARSETGSQRIGAALSGSSANAPAAERPIHALEGELRLLTETVRALTADRDRLLARLEALERSAEHTGSVSPTSASRCAAAQPGMEDASQASRTFAAMRFTRSEFGLDLGDESSLEALRGLWMIIKVQHGAVVEDLRPVATIRDHSGGAPELRLVAGPLANAAHAVRLCAVIGETGRACRPAPFEGQRLMLR